MKYKTLYNGLIKNGGEFKGSGRHTSNLTLKEEMRIMDHVKWRASVGYGIDWSMLRLLLQELFQALKQANPARMTGLDDCGQLPSLAWVRRFAKRHQS